MPVVITSRVPNGRVLPNYGFEGGGKTLVDASAVTGNDLSQQKARILLGLIVYELITNAVRHAFHGRNGEIRVELLRAGAFVHCKVMDNGSAPAHVQRGHGLKIIEELVKALDGQFKQRFGTAGSTSVLVFPHSRIHLRPWRSPKTCRNTCPI